MFKSVRYVGYMRPLKCRGSVRWKVEVHREVQGKIPLIWGRIFAMGSAGKWEQGYAPEPYFATL